MVQARALDPAGEGEKDRKSMSGTCACKRRTCGASARALGPVGEREREREMVLRVAGARACVVAAKLPPAGVYTQGGPEQAAAQFE